MKIVENTPKSSSMRSNVWIISIELTVRRLVTDRSLPVLTFGDMERILADRKYCERCAERLAEIVIDLKDYRGVTRLYLT